MNAHLLGEITLSVSTVVYFIWFVPQLLMNFRRKNTDGFSLWMHGLLFIGYCADLLYGFGRHMQWQYRLVTISGLFFLTIEHVQFWLYGNHTRSQRINFYILTIVIGVLLFYAAYNVYEINHSKHYYNLAGYLSDFCWMTYIIPQIIKNYQLKSTKGLSPSFVIMSIVLTMLDMVSTFALHWALPSVISQFITLAKKSILIGQMYYYKLTLRKPRSSPG